MCSGYVDRTPFPVVQTTANESQAQLSPDGRWIAYVSNESGPDEVYVQSFPKPGSKRQVSVGGGDQPRWRRDGQELFYLAPDLKLMSVKMKAGETLDTGSPAPLFQTRLAFLGARAPDFRQTYAVSADGQRFLLTVTTEEARLPFTVIVNWTAALKR